MTTQIEKMIAQMINETIKQNFTDSEKIEIITEQMPTKLAESLGMQAEQMKLLFWGVANKIEGAL
jgi:hypothetical protein